MSQAKARIAAIRGYCIAIVLHIFKLKVGQFDAAAYATDLDEKYRTSERAIFRDFLQKLISLDKRKTIQQLVWEEFSGSIRLLLDNRYIYQDFWNYRNGKLTETEWLRNFADANRAARIALAQRETATVLSVVLSRLYTLRNQLMHGGATWNSSINRDQVRDCANLLGNSGRNSVYGPGLQNLDFSLFKNNPVHRISDTFNIQFRWEVFNIANHANFNPPAPAARQIFATSGAVNNAGLLASPTTDSSRQMQFALKFIW